MRTSSKPPGGLKASAVTLTLTGYRAITTEEASSAPLDVFTVQLWEDAQTTTGLVGDLAVFSNEDPTSGWVSFTGTINVESHAGRTVELDLFAQTDSSLVTEFHVDSLALAVEACR